MTTLNTKLIKTIIGSNEEVEFLFNKLNFLEKLTNEYDSVTFDERLQSIIDNADEISFNGLITLFEKSHWSLGDGMNRIANLDLLYSFV